MYDYPSPPSSSSPPSPCALRKQHRRRSQSPLPHLATLLPTPNHNHHHHHHHHHQYSPSTRAADVSRLLDPAYASSSSSSSSCPTPSPNTQTRAYVDHNGDLHDPDYRDFPVLRATARSYQPGKPRRTSASSAARSRSHDRHSIAMHPPRPNWERGWATETGDDSDDENEEDEVESQSHFSPFASHQGSPRKQSSAFRRTTYPSQHYYYADMPLTSSPMGSYEDESPSPNALQLHESPFGDDDEEVIEESRKSTSLIRKVSKPKKAMSVEVETEKDEEESSVLRALDEVHDDDDEHATTPTCTHVLRQQWHAVTLRIRFGVFRAKRRLATKRRT